MAKQSGKGKVRRFLRFLITPANPTDPSIRVPVRRSLVGLVTLGLILLEVWYFYAVPYAGIPSKTVFWAAFLGWGLIPIVLQWGGRNLPTKRAINLQGNFFIVFGIGGLILVLVAERVSSLLPVVEAAMPGAMAGGVVAAVGSIAWQRPKTKP